MTQRNPMNERYQNTDEKKTGKTRKSAASAKPTTKAASSVRIVGGSEPKARSRYAKAQRRVNAQKNQQQAKKKDSAAYFKPTSPEYKKWRKIWIALIIVALVATSVSFWLAGRFESRISMYALLVLGWAALIGAVVVDMTKVRKARNAEMAAYAHSKSKAATKQRKADKAARAQEYEQVKEAAEAERAKDAGKKGRGLFGFGKKKSSDEHASEEA